jgi:hypothetical protein
MTKESSPLACRLPAFGAEQRAAHRERTRKLLSAAKYVEELPDGWRLTLPHANGHFKDAAEWVRVERECCPFLTFDFTIEGPRDPFRLAIRGPAGSKQAIESELGALGGLRTA